MDDQEGNAPPSSTQDIGVDAWASTTSRSRRLVAQAQRVAAWTVANRITGELAIRACCKRPRTVTDLNPISCRIALPRIEALEVPSRLDGLPIQAWMAIPAGRKDRSAPDPRDSRRPLRHVHPQLCCGNSALRGGGLRHRLGESPGLGSTGCGVAFAQEIDEAYLGPDHEDLMSDVVDAVVAQGWVDKKRLFILRAAPGAACWAPTPRA